MYGVSIQNGGVWSDPVDLVFIANNQGKIKRQNMTAGTTKTQTNEPTHPKAMTNDQLFTQGKERTWNLIDRFLIYLHAVGSPEAADGGIPRK